MLKSDPEQLILSWLDQMPKKYRGTLIRQYIFMTCTDGGDLALGDDAGWQYFRKKLTEPDFPLRRVARLLTARSLLSFILDFPSPNSYEENLSDGSAKTLTSLDGVQHQRAGQQFQRMIESGLSDTALYDWFQDLESRF